MRTTRRLAGLVLLAGLVVPAGVQADSLTYGVPDPPPGHGRPYSQRSFRFYWAHRAWESHHPVSVQSYPCVQTNIEPEFYIHSYHCPYVYPENVYRQSTPPERGAATGN